ncbi:flippase [Thermococcus atlanticus]
MSDATQALHRIARGTGIIFAGTVISMFFGFLSRAIIAREFSKAEYGVFNLALTVLSIGLVIATLGFQNALPREVAFYREKMPKKVDRLVSTAIAITAVSAVITALLIFFLAGDISLIFREERLVSALRVIVLALPFSALTAVIISVSRGFGRVRERVYFQNMVYPITWLVLVASIAALGLPFNSMFYAYSLAQLLTFSALLIEAYRIGLLRVGARVDIELGKHLVAFSIPLMLVGILNFMMTWTDTLMLGYYKGSEVVGIYNAASPLARLIPVFLGSAGMLYAPIVTPLYAQGKIKEMGRVYQVLTKWIFMLTLPLFSLMFLFPETTIRLFFGAKYVSAAPALQILALGFMFHTFLGLNGLSLLVIGKPKLNMIGDTFAVISNVLLNFLLIPPYGIVGAAVATAVSYFVANVFRSFWLYRRTGIHPFSWNYVKPLVISFVLLGIIKGLNLKVPSIWYAVPVLVVFLGVYALLVLLSRSIDREDVELLLAVERKTGIDLGIIKRVLRKFV